MHGVVGVLIYRGVVSKEQVQNATNSKMCRVKYMKYDIRMQSRAFPLLYNGQLSAEPEEVDLFVVPMVANMAPCSTYTVYHPHYTRYLVYHRICYIYIYICMN